MHLPKMKISILFSFRVAPFGQIKGLRRRFAQLDEDGTGVLSRDQFCDMLAGVGIFLTAHEQEQIKERCDRLMTSRCTCWLVSWLAIASSTKGS